MYHYVRDMENSEYPNIKGLSTEQFREQLSYINKHYTVISADNLMDAIESGGSLPKNALLLTFDDGYIDHFQQVFPLLEKQNLPGLFFPSAKCVDEKKVLDVNKVHFILSSAHDHLGVVHDMFTLIDKYRSQYNLNSNEYYLNSPYKKNRYDPEEVTLIKQMLQYKLPETLRCKITNSLFKKYVTKDEAGFSQELYMSRAQIACLKENGMYIGSHGYGHYWLNTLSEDDQKREIDLSMNFLESIGSNTRRWIMCYPYGAHNHSLLNLLKKRGCVAGLTINIGIADITKDNLLTLPRLDTNDLPVTANAVPNQWTTDALT